MVARTSQHQVSRGLRRKIVGEVLSHGIKLSAVGPAIALMGAFLRRSFASLVFDVSSSDPPIALAVGSERLVWAVPLALLLLFRRPFWVAGAPLGGPRILKLSRQFVRPVTLPRDRAIARKREQE